MEVVRVPALLNSNTESIILAIGAPTGCCRRGRGGGGFESAFAPENQDLRELVKETLPRDLRSQRNAASEDDYSVTKREVVAAAVKCLRPRSKN